MLPLLPRRSKAKRRGVRSIVADYLFLGALNRDFILPPRGRPLLDVPGGPVVYAAAGAALWGAKVGLVARVGEDFPRQWLDDLTARGWDLAGVRVLPHPLEARRVLVYDDEGERTAGPPLGAFARRGVPLPKALLNYAPPPRTAFDAPTLYSLRLSDLPVPMTAVRGAHFCPHDFVTHSLLPAAMRTAGVPFITLEPAPDYMDARFFDRLPSLMSGLQVVIVREKVLRALFLQQTGDLWHMAATLGQWQVEYVVIRRSRGEMWLYDARGDRRWVLPGYPVRRVDPTGVGDAFAGAFLATYRETLDPVRAVARGAATASVALETRGALALLETLPELLHARAAMIEQAARQV